MHLWHRFGQSQGATYVEAFADFEEDAGSTPATSTKRVNFKFEKQLSSLVNLALC